MWVSFFVTVEGIERILFVLPRERRVEQDDDGNIHETDVVPKTEDVHDDFDMIRKQMKIKSRWAKFVKRNYAFGEKGCTERRKPMVKGGLWLSWLACVCSVLIFLMSLIEPVIPMSA